MYLREPWRSQRTKGSPLLGRKVGPRSAVTAAAAASEIEIEIEVPAEHDGCC